jgi:hypothetical protein
VPDSQKARQDTAGLGYKEITHQCLRTT